MSKVIYKVGDDISTDVIYPGRFMATVLPSETPMFAFADDKDFNKKLRTENIEPGSIIIGGENFGCGSSREQAASTLKGYDVIVIAKGIARIFMQNAINLGLRTIIAPAIEASEGDEIEIDENKVHNRTTGKSFDYEPISPARASIVEAGGLISYARQKLMEKN
ncbi:MAG: 3-isopropylmalate dehydratase small subunit [Deferribacteres bacterium]|nr:3-isopropylmalate dehydratase small subunit [candidate division KSB1 bacterium]MCB9501308.1 3-isopropylmalate dehydratase small subunit [Deferribacteres bacterium]